MIDFIYSPRTVISAKRDYAAKGNRLNAVFMSNIMHDGDAVRKLIHNKTADAPDILRALYRYYAEHRNKETLWDDIDKINENSNHYGNCGIYAETDKHGNKIIIDWNYRWSGRESYWADLAHYDKRCSINIDDDFGYGYKKYVNASVAEVLADTLNNRTYAIMQQPQTPDKNLNLLLQNLFYAKYHDETELNEPAYYKALHLLNDNLENAFSAGEKLLAKQYVPAIIFVDEMSAQVFDKIDYPKQRVFYQTPLGQECLRFTYLTALGVHSFEKEAMHTFLNEVKSQTLWQTAQSRITQEFMHWGYRSSVAANRWTELNLIKPLPDEKVYRPYYQTDLERAQYMNLYQHGLKTAGRE